MPLTSSSTLAEIEAAYIDNASYAENSDADKCRSFITACRVLLLKMPKQTGSREGNVMMTPDLIQREKQAAEEWIAANASAVGAGGTAVGTSVRVSFRNSRD